MYSGTEESLLIKYIDQNIKYYIIYKYYIKYILIQDICQEN